MWYVSLNGCGHQSPVQMIRLRLNATAKPGNFVRIRPICCAAVSWAGRWRRLDRPMVRIAKHRNHCCRCRDNTSHRRNSKQGAAAVCLHVPGLPQNGLINHAAKHTLREPPRIAVRQTNFSPCCREFADAIVERKVCSWTGVPPFTEVLHGVNRIRYLQSPPLGMGCVQSRHDSIQYLKQSRRNRLFSAVQVGG